MAGIKRHPHIRFSILFFLGFLLALAIPAGAWAQTLTLPDLGVDTTPVTSLTETVTDTVNQLLPIDLSPVTDTVNDTVDQLETTLPPLPDLPPPLPDLPPLPPPLPPLPPPLDDDDDDPQPALRPPDDGGPGPGDSPTSDPFAEMGSVMDSMAATVSPNSAFKAAPADSSDWPISDDPSAMVLAALPLLGLVCAFIAISSYLNVARKIHLGSAPIDGLAGR